MISDRLDMMIHKMLLFIKKLIHQKLPHLRSDPIRTGKVALVIVQGALSSTGELHHSE
jgi:hypothetical protein